MAIFTKNKRLQEASFSSEKDFEKEINDNFNLLFGEKTILIDKKKRLTGGALGDTIPDAFLFDLSDINNPNFYLVEYELSKHSFNNHILPQITKFLSFFINSQQRRDLTRKLYETIKEDKELENQFQNQIGDREIYKFIHEVIDESQNILIVIDGEKQELSEIGKIHTDTWGKRVKCIVIRKFSNSTDTVYHLEPDFEILELIPNSEIPTEKQDAEIKNYNEEDHTNRASKVIVNTYQALKKKILDINPETIFNPTRYYISIRTNKNHVFLEFRRNKINAAVKSPEDEIRKLITKYEVKTLPQSVQKSYGSESAAIIIKDASGIDELVELLKPLISDNK